MTEGSATPERFARARRSAQRRSASNGLGLSVGTVRVRKEVPVLTAAEGDTRKLWLCAMRKTRERAYAVPLPGCGLLDSSFLYLVSGLLREKNRCAALDAGGAQRARHPATPPFQGHTEVESLDPMHAFLAQGSNRPAFAMPSRGAALNREAISHCGFDNESTTLSRVAILLV